MAPPPHRVAASPANSAVLALSGVAGIAAGTAVLLVAYGSFQGWFAAAPHAAERQPPALPAKPAAAPVRPLPPPPRSGEVSARRAPDGHFYFDTAVNGVAARMVFDTGASYVTLRQEDAARLGINVSTLEFTGRSRTANGITEVAPVMLDTLRVGDILRRNVQAVVLRPGKLGVNLLGQSFMSKLKGYRVENGEMVLQGN